MTFQHAVHSLRWAVERICLRRCVRFGGLVHYQSESMGFDGVDEGGDHVLKEYQ